MPRDIHSPRRIARAPAVQMRSQKHIDLQPRQKLFVAFKAHMRQNHAVVRIADDLLGDRVAAFRIAIHVANAEGLRMDVLERRHQIALFLVNKRLPVTHQKLHVADLRTVDRGVVYLVEDPVRAGEPDAARRGIRRADRVFHA